MKVTSVRSEPEDPRFYIINERIGRLPALKPNYLVEVRLEYLLRMFVIVHLLSVWMW